MAARQQHSSFVCLIVWFHQYLISCMRLGLSSNGKSTLPPNDNVVLGGFSRARQLMWTEFARIQWWWIDEHEWQRRRMDGFEVLLSSLTENSLRLVRKQSRRTNVGKWNWMEYIQQWVGAVDCSLRCGGDEMSKTKDGFEMTFTVLWRKNLWAYTRERWAAAAAVEKKMTKKLSNCRVVEIFSPWQSCRRWNRDVEGSDSLNDDRGSDVHNLALPPKKWISSESL